MGLRMNRLVSWAIVFTLLMNVFALAFFVQQEQATETICAEAEGSVNPLAAIPQQEVSLHGFESVDWWPMFQHDPQHTGCSAEQAPDTNGTLWIYQTGDDVVSSPAVADGWVFVGSWDWRFYCLDYSTGVELWRQNIGGWPYSSSPAVADGVVYVGSTQEYSSRVLALNATTGAVIWVRDFGFQQRGNLNIHEGILYVGSRGGLYALNATTGSSVWSSPEGTWLWGSPAISNGVIYVSHGFNLTARNATTGSLLWTKKVGSGIVTDESAPSTAYGMVFIGREDGTWALNATDGGVVWSSSSGSMESAPAVSDGRLFITRRGSPGILALNATTGDVVWNCASCSDVASSPAVGDGKVYLGTLGAKIYALNETNGEISWVYQASSGFWGSSPAIVDGKLYIGSLDGKVYAFGEPHDVAIMSVKLSKDVVGQGHFVSISVAVRNQGIYTETFDVNVTSGLQVVQTQTATIAGGSDATISLSWNTTDFSKGNYTISAYATPVPGETDTSDNTCIDGWVLVSIPGDINGDRKVDLADVYAVARAFGSVLNITDGWYWHSPPRSCCPHSPNCDINGDGKIDLKDYYTTCKNYGRSW